MRLSRSEIRARVKSDLSITFSDERITAYGGLELLRRYFVAIDRAGRLRRALGDSGDYGAVGFLRTVLAELREHFGRCHRLEVRLDGAFFYPEVLAFLDGETLGYAIKVPLWKWLGVRQRIASRTHWTRVDGNAFSSTESPFPSRDQQTNLLWQQISVLTHNLVRSFQFCLGASARPRNRKRTLLPSPARSRPSASPCHQPARIVRPAGRQELRFAVSPETQQRIEDAERRIRQAAWTAPQLRLHRGA